MTVFIILASVAVLFSYVLTRKIRLVAEYTDKPSVYVRLLFYKYPIFPPKTQDKPKKSGKKAKAVPQQEEAKDGEDIHGLLELASGIIKAILGKTLRYIKIKLVRVRVTVGTDDAAHTALLYGIIAQSAAYLIDLLDRITNVYPKDVSISADFTASKSCADISMELNIKVWQVLHLALLTAMEYIKITDKRKKDSAETAGKKV